MIKYKWNDRTNCWFVFNVKYLYCIQFSTTCRILSTYKSTDIFLLEVLTFKEFHYVSIFLFLRMWTFSPFSFQEIKIWKILLLSNKVYFDHIRYLFSSLYRQLNDSRFGQKSFDTHTYFDAHRITYTSIFDVSPGKWSDLMHTN